MHRTSSSRCWTRVLLLFVVALLLAGRVVPASAEPTTPERRQVAEEVATTACKAVPSIPRLPAKFDPKALCKSVLVENLDPEGTNKGMKEACIAALPGVAVVLATTCVRVLDKLLDPARAVFLDKIVPAVKQLACVATTPGAFDCLAQQVHVWLKDSITSLWSSFTSELTKDTRAIGLLEGWKNPGVVSLYSDVGSVAASVLLGLFLVSLITALLRVDVRGIGSALFAIAMWGIFWVSGAAIALLLLKASDGAAAWLAGRPDKSGQTDLQRAGAEFGRWVDYMATATKDVPQHPLWNPGSFTGILVCTFLIVAIVIAVITLMLRNVALVLLVVFFPLTLAGRAGPEMTRGWLVTAMRIFVPLLLAKPLIVVAVRLGAVLVSVPKAGRPQATLSDALLGIAVLLIAGLLPGIIYKLSGLVPTSAGGGPRAGQGLTEQSAQSGQTFADTTRLVMARNSPQALSAGGGGALAQGRVGAAGGGMSVGGALGVAGAGLALAGGALEGAGRFAAGHAATGGGVLGDVEAPRVPHPPISRGGAGGGGGGSSTSPPAQPSASAAMDTGRQQVDLSLVPRPAPPSAPAVEGSQPLVIPGEVVPDRAPPAPRELPEGGSRND